MYSKSHVLEFAANGSLLAHRDIISRYHRTVEHGGSDSLAALARWVPRNARVLDVGCATGGLGAFLRERLGCRVDGVDAAVDALQMARPSYEILTAADLETSPLTSLFPARRYDVVVLADVLEHLRNPGDVLADAVRLLAPGGQILLSIPNVTYGPALAELLWGDLHYRSSGIFDDTHVRFYCRATLMSLLRASGLRAVRVDVVEKAPHESEFGTAGLEALPPGVRRFLASHPDADAYQFLVAAVPDEDSDLRGTPLEAPRATKPALPLRFSIGLSWREQCRGYGSDRQVLTFGTVAGGRQLLELRFPAVEGPVSGVRLDIADRSGLVKLWGLRLTGPSGDLSWAWDGDLETVRSPLHERLILQETKRGIPPVLLMLSHSGSALEIPAPTSALEAITEGSALEIDLDWPVSPEHLAVVERLTGSFEALESAERKIEALLEERARLAALLDERLELWERTERDRVRAVEECRRVRALLASDDRQEHSSSWKSE